MKMTKRTVDKRTTNPAMRIVRAHYPGIGHAYSDKRSYGRRYKFSERRSSESAVNALNTLFRLSGVNAKAELHKGNNHGWCNWENHLVIKSYGTSPAKKAKKAPSNKSAAKKWKVTTPAEISNQVDNLVDSWSEQELKLLMKMAGQFKEINSNPAPVSNTKTFTFTEEQLILFTKCYIRDFVENHAKDNILRTLQENTTNELCPDVISVNVSIESDTGVMKMRPAINEWILMEEIETSLDELVMYGLSAGAIERLAQFATQH